MLYKLKKASCTPNNQNFKKNSKHNWSRETNLFISATAANYSINASHIAQLYIIYIYFMNRLKGKSFIQRLFILPLLLLMGTRLFLLKNISKQLGE